MFCLILLQKEKKESKQLQGNIKQSKFLQLACRFKISDRLVKYLNVLNVSFKEQIY